MRSSCYATQGRGGCGWRRFGGAMWWDGRFRRRAPWGRCWVRCRSPRSTSKPPSGAEHVLIMTEHGPVAVGFAQAEWNQAPGAAHACWLLILSSYCVEVILTSYCVEVILSSYCVEVSCSAQSCFITWHGFLSVTGDLLVSCRLRQPPNAPAGIEKALQAAQHDATITVPTLPCSCSPNTKQELEESSSSWTLHVAACGAQWSSAQL